MRRSHALACDRLEGWPQALNLPPSFETHWGRQVGDPNAPQDEVGVSLRDLAPQNELNLPRDPHGRSCGRHTLRPHPEEVACACMRPSRRMAASSELAPILRDALGSPSRRPQCSSESDSEYVFDISGSCEATGKDADAG